MRPGYDIVVPVHDGADVLSGTLERLAAHSSGDDRIFLVDDASMDPRVGGLIGERVSDPRFRATRLAANEGFVAVANRGFATTTRDVVLLNADAWVTEGWLDRLHECRASSPAIAAACPLSDNATLLTIPGLRGPGAPGIDRIARAVASAARGRFERLPTAHGFCMLVTRAALARVGGFDPAFGRGYGEENDWSMRALRAGLEIACAEGAFVSHVGEASFGSAKGTSRLRSRNAALLDARWPGYAAGVSRWCRRNPLREAFERVHRELALAGPDAKPRLLLVGYRYGHLGGIEEHLRRTLPFVTRSFDTTVLALDRLGEAWADAREVSDPSGARVLFARAESIRPPRRIVGLAASLRDEAAERFFETVVAAGRFDLVHFHSLVGWGSLELPAIARRHGASVVASVHDLFLLCPDYNMVGADGRPCGKAAASGDDPGCVSCLAAKEQVRAGAPAPEPLRGFLGARHPAVARALSACDRVVAPSDFSARALARAHPDAAGRTVVIAHGVAFTSKLASPRRSSTLRVAFLGRFGPRKGAGVVIEAASRLAGEMIEITVHGVVDPGLPGPREGAALRFAGPYRNEDLPSLLADTDLVVVPSIVEEAYCLTFSEAQALGVPVVASPVGAIAERLEDGRTGFAFAAGDAAALASLLRGLSRNLAALDEVRFTLRGMPARSDAECAADYASLYERLLRERCGEVGEIAPPRDDAMWWLPLLRLGDGPARPPAHEAMPGPPCLPTQVFIRNGRGDAAALERTLASLEPARGPLLEVTVTGDRTARPRRAGALLVLEAGDEAGPDLLAEGTRVLTDDPACRLVAFDDDRVSSSGERYGERLRAGINPAALASGASLCRAIVRAEALGEDDGVPGSESGALALRLLATWGAGAARHVPRVLCHVTDIEGEDGAGGGNAGDEASSPGRLAVIVYCDEDRPANAAAANAWLHPQWKGRLQVAVLEAHGEEVTVANGHGGEQGCVRTVDLRGLDSLASRLDRVIAELCADTILVQSDRVSWPDAQAPSRLLAAVASTGVALACPVILLPDRRVHHAGYVLGSGPAGIAGNLLEGRRWGEPLPAPFDSPRRDVSAVSGLAFALRRDAWEFTGAQAEPATFELTMVARCLRYAGRGWRMVACLDSPAVLAAPQASPVEAPAPPAMRAAFLDRWLPRLAHDPFHHPRLALNPPWRKVDAFAAPWAARPALGRKVVAFPFDDWGSGHYRVRGPMAALAKAGGLEAAIMPGHASGLAPTVAEMTRLAPDAILAHDFLHDYQLAALADYARHVPALRVFGLDDLLTALPSGNPYSRTIYPDIAARIRRALALCDRLVVTTPALAEAFRGLCADTRVIPNRLERDRWVGLARGSRPAGGKTRVGWAGARQHEGDLAWLEPVLAATKGVVDWVFLGMCPDALRPHAAEVHPMVPFAQFPARLAGLALDVAVAPLEDHPFNDAKSALRVLEYGVLGLPVIASDRAPYRATPATLLPNEAPAWIDAVRHWAGDPDAAARQGGALKAWVLANGILEDHLEEWRGALK